MGKLLLQKSAFVFSLMWLSASLKYDEDETQLNLKEKVVLEDALVQN